MPAEHALNASPAGGEPGPIGLIGHTTLAVVGYLGGIGILAFSIPRAIVRPVGNAPAFVRTTIRQMDRLFVLGMPMLAVIHVGMGSFMAMQAYFGATFVDGNGAVVGVGLIRNVAPLMTGLTLAGLLSALYIPELRRGRSEVGFDDPDATAVDRDVARGFRFDERTPVEPARMAAPRVVAALLAGPFLAFWSAAIGTAVGWSVSMSLLGVTTDGYFSYFFEMMWFRDATGLVAKGALYGGIASLMACYEGVHCPEPTADASADFERVARLGCRAFVLATMMILMINSGWFLVHYHAGTGLGPTVLPSPR